MFHTGQLTMQILKNTFWVSVVTLLFLLAGCKGEDPITIDFKYDYYPLEIGHWISYDVDSITYDDFTTPVTVDTASFQVREYVESIYMDLDNRETYRIEKQIRNNSAQNWIIDDAFQVNLLPTNLQKVEYDFRYIKLIFPPRANETWDGNLYIDVIDNPQYEYLDRDRYDWEYVYESVDEPFEINGFSFDSTLTVIQIDDENAFEKKYSKEIYAKHVGMIYREFIILETQLPPTGVPFEERAELGFIIRYTINDYGQ